MYGDGGMSSLWQNSSVFHITFRSKRRVKIC